MKFMIRGYSSLWRAFFWTHHSVPLSMAVPKFFFSPSLFLNSLFIDHLALVPRIASSSSSRLCKNTQSDKHPPHNVWEMKMKRDAAAAKKRPCGILSDSFVSLLLGFVRTISLGGAPTHFSTGVFLGNSEMGSLRCCVSIPSVGVAAEKKCIRLFQLLPPPPPLLQERRILWGGVLKSLK